jgi:dTDP-4-dehydrorhamnose 3,5-epimerase
LYRTTDFWAPEHERCIIWNDSDLGIGWPKDIEPQLSAKDAVGTPFKKADLFS